MALATSQRFGIVKRWMHSWNAWRQGPAILHVTHWKAGSQWIYKILNRCCRERVIAPRERFTHLLEVPPRPGLIYPTVYATRQELDRLTFNCPVRRFVVIRDPRDTIISLYFSAKVSHPPMKGINERRPTLVRMEEEDGLCYLISETPSIGRMIRSWLGTDDPLIRYEDLLTQDEVLLTRVLLEHCQMRVSRDRLLEAIRANRFEQLTKGRQRGEEDVNAHERKGIAGDWRNHFTPRVKEAFKRQYGDLVVASGYERDDNW
jgi:sulfotransferase family protein